MLKKISVNVKIQFGIAIAVIFAVNMAQGLHLNKAWADGSDSGQPVTTQSNEEYEKEIENLINEYGEDYYDANYGSDGSYNEYSDYDFDSKDDGNTYNVNIIRFPKYDVTFNSASSMYCYRLSDGECFYLNIPMGAVTTGKVDIIIPKGASLYGMEFDGENKNVPDSLEFTEPGEYILYVMSTKYDDISSQGTTSVTKEPDEENTGSQDTPAADTSNIDTSDSSIYKFSIYFKISTGIETDFKVINSPVNFKVSSVKCNGLETESHSYYACFKKDGFYSVVFEEENNPVIKYSVSFQIDRNAPYITFSKDVMSGEAKAPVTIQTGESDAVIKVYKNGAVSSDTYTLTTGGNYRISVSDKYGNTRDYSFYLNYNGNFLADIPLIPILVIIFFCICALGVWLLRVRRDIGVL